MEKRNRKISNPEFEAAAKALKASSIPFILVGILESGDDWIFPDYYARADSTATAVDLLKSFMSGLEEQAKANGAKNLARFCRAVQSSIKVEFEEED